jgi:hypothetical protein
MKAYAKLGVPPLMTEKEMMEAFAIMTMEDVEYAKKMQKEMPNDP